jgi:type II secretory pathway pseudopilin PulG
MSHGTPAAQTTAIRPVGGAPPDIRPIPGDGGYSLLELLFVLGTMATIGGIAIPAVTAAFDEQRAAGAVRYVATRIQRVRMEAVSRRVNVALRFDTGTPVSFRVYVDGDGDGVRADDIAAGVDPAEGPPERLPDNFRGVDFGVLPALPPVESGSSPPGSDPIRLGTARVLSYSAAGTSSSGSLYVLGHGSVQFVVRVLGDTGRVRVLEFDVRRRQWKPV